MPVRRRTLPRLSAGAIVRAALSALGTAHAQQIVLSNARGLDFGRFVANTGGQTVEGNTTRVLASDLDALSNFLRDNFDYDTGP